MLLQSIFAEPQLLPNRWPSDLNARRDLLLLSRLKRQLQHTCIEETICTE